MDNETMVLLTGLLGTIMVTGLLGSAIVGAYFLGRSRSAGRADQSATGTDAARLERIERLLEGLAIDVERIGEAQRFAARTVSGRPSESLLDGARDETRSEKG